MALDLPFLDAYILISRAVGVNWNVSGDKARREQRWFS